MPEVGGNRAEVEHILPRFLCGRRCSTLDPRASAMRVGVNGANPGRTGLFKHQAPSIR